MKKHRQEEVDRLIADLDFPALYRGYAWKNDTWEKGFSEILGLEREVTAAARDQALGLGHVQKIARRAGLPDRTDCAGRRSAVPWPALSATMGAPARGLRR